MKDSGAQGSQMMSSNEKNHKPMMSLLGSAFVVVIAYMDPGNVVANLSADTSYRHPPLQVLAASDLMAMVVQYLPTKRGLATGQPLTKGVADHFGSNRPG